MPTDFVMSDRPLVPLSAITEANPFILVAILDSSGSMFRYRDDVIASFNNLLADQKRVSTPTVLHLAIFNKNVHHVHKATPLKLVRPIAPHEYQPDGGTALFDAIGASMDALVLEYPGQRRGVVFIHTDGKEADSRFYTHERMVASIAKAQKNGWDFIFVGADPRSANAGRDLGMQSVMQYDASAQGVHRSYATISHNLAKMRSRDVTSTGVSWTDDSGPATFSAGGKRFRRA